MTSARPGLALCLILIAAPLAAQDRPLEGHWFVAAGGYKFHDVDWKYAPSQRLDH